MDVATTTNSDNFLNRWARGKWFLVLGAWFVAVDIAALVAISTSEGCSSGFSVFLVTDLGLVLGALALRRAHPTLAGALMGLAIVPFFLLGGGGGGCD